MKNTIIIITLFIVSTGLISQTWEKQNSGVTTSLNSFFFNNLYTGYAAGDGGKIIKTTNGGLNWIIQYVNETNWFSTIWFVNMNIGFTGGMNTSSFKTTNGGLNWTFFNMGSSRYQIQFIDALTGYNVGPGQQVMKTTDGGITWVFKNPYSTTSFYMLSAVNADTVYFGGGISKIFKTTDGGDSYIQMNSPNNTLPGSLFFVNAETGYCTGVSGPPYFLAKTTNGGVNWLNILYSNKIAYYDIRMINENTGFVTADKNRIDFLMKTTNAGISWSKSFYYDNWIQASYFINEKTGFVGGYDGAIFKTTNGGELPAFSVSGTIKYSDNNQPVSSGKVKALKYFRGTNQFVVIDSAAIQTNGSYVMPYIPRDSLYIMAFQDDEENASFVPTYYSSTIYWQSANIIYPESNLTGIDVSVFRNNLSSNNLHIGGNVNTSGTSMTNLPDVIIYAKSGNEFKGYSVSASNGNYKIDKLGNGSYDIITDRIGYVSSQIPVILNNSNIDNLNFTLHQYLIGIGPPGGIVPESFRLFQNYPNPFNPNTVISFQVPVNSFTDLKVFDLLGRELTTLVYEELKPGTYEVEWNGANYASGVYFYKLISGDYTETKKMLLVK